MTEERLKARGKTIKQKVRHSFSPPEKHITDAMDGDTKGSHIEETYEEVGGGTKVTVSGEVKVGGLLGKLLSPFVGPLFSSGMKNLLKKAEELVKA